MTSSSSTTSRSWTSRRVTIQGLEALVRWNHPERGFIGPDKFIPVAETTGIIGAIGAWVLGQACRDVAALDWRSPPLWISVNLSAVQLEDENLVATVSQALEECGLDASRLTLEVTETVIMNDVPRSIQVLTALRKVGLKIAIDDFGTGYSSLGALRYLPGRHAEDRQVIRDRSGARPGLFGPDSPHLAAGGRLPSSHRGRGRRGSGAARDLARLRLRRRTGFLFARPQPLADIVEACSRPA